MTNLTKRREREIDRNSRGERKTRERKIMKVKAKPRIEGKRKNFPTRITGAVVSQNKDMW